MPIYEYACQECGHQLDALQKIADAHLTDCPECNASALKRMISAPRFRLKGQGWYETDFKTDKDKRRNLADSGDSGPKETSTKPKTDAGDKSAKEKPVKASTGKAGGDGKAA